MSNPPLANFTNISLPNQIASQVPFFTSDINATATSQRIGQTRTQWAYEPSPNAQPAGVFSPSQQPDWQSKHNAHTNTPPPPSSKKKPSHQKPVTSAKKQKPPKAPKLPAPKIDWDNPFNEGEMYGLIQRFAYGFSGGTEREAFIDGCRRSVKFYQAVQWMARFYYKQSQDAKWGPKVRKEDLERAMKLKAAMEEAKGETLPNLFRLERGWEHAIGEWGLRVILNLLPQRFARAWPIRFDDPEDD